MTANDKRLDPQSNGIWQDPEMQIGESEVLQRWDVASSGNKHSMH
jgi:hypothetical protein